MCAVYGTSRTATNESQTPKGENRFFGKMRRYCTAVATTRMRFLSVGFVAAPLLWLVSSCRVCVTLTAKEDAEQLRGNVSQEDTTRQRLYMLVAVLKAKLFNVSQTARQAIQRRRDK